MLQNELGGCLCILRMFLCMFSGRPLQYQVLSETPVGNPLNVRHDQTIFIFQPLSFPPAPLAQDPRLNARRTPFGVSGGLRDVLRFSGSVHF